MTNKVERTAQGQQSDRLTARQQVLRLSAEANARLKRIAEIETAKSMSRVHPAHVMRRFIEEGLVRYEREHAQEMKRG